MPCPQVIPGLGVVPESQLSNEHRAIWPLCVCQGNDPVGCHGSIDELTLCGAAHRHIELSTPYDVRTESWHHRPQPRGVNGLDQLKPLIRSSEVVNHWGPVIEHAQLFGYRSEYV